MAEHWGSPVISCDSRQLYRDIPIGTAAPTVAEQARVKHYFIGCKGLEDDYNAGEYERDALTLINQLFVTHDVLVVTGGSMLYIDALCEGLDDLPAVPAAIRAEVRQQYEQGGLAWLQSEVARLDATYWAEVDRHNPARLAHCVELCRTTGRPYSQMRTRSSKIRPFRIVKIGLQRPREELYARINRRVDQMIADGLVAEAQRVYPYRTQNSLQTVGYREIFAYMDGEYDLSRAIALIKQSTRHYAKRQLTWFRRDKSIHWLDANEEYEKNINIITGLLRDDCMQESGCSVHL